MWHTRLALICLCVIFVGIRTQETSGNDHNTNDEDDETAEKNGETAGKNSPVDTSKQDRQRFARAPSLPAVVLAKSEACSTDVNKYCAKGTKTPLPNLKVLQCFDDLDDAVHIISADCQHTVYQFKLNMTLDIRFDDVAQKRCSKDLNILLDCKDHSDEPGTGRLVTCLHDRMQNITEADCRSFIKQLQSMIFNDWRLTEYFVTKCLDDIKKHECGRLEDHNKTVLHDQGAVVGCLSMKIDELTSDCKKQISRLAEMQSEDYHLDRALYYACREDRERLCTQTSAGNGRVYRCLYRNKFNKLMSSACRAQVHRRQLMVVSDVKMDLPFTRACVAEMREHQCGPNTEDPEKPFTLAGALQCLEESFKKGNHIQDECRREMLLHRQMLMSDYILSPDIVAQCKEEIMQHCATFYQQSSNTVIDERSGKMIHCLFKAARQTKNFSPSCLNSVKSLLRAANPGEDVRADPLLERDCHPVVESACANMQPGGSTIIMCLLDNLKSPRMTDICEDRLMEIAYFMARDWRLTPRLLTSCRKPMTDFCAMPTNWSMSDTLNDTLVGIYLGCLYQHRRQLETECSDELRRLMRIRSKSIGLMPEVEENCIADLATCTSVDRTGEELQCLQKKYEKLEPSCQAAVGKITQMTVNDPTLDVSLMKVCEQTIQLFCSNARGGNENDLTRCLIQHKNEARTDVRCRAAINHHQIISLKDEAFLSEKFKAQCKDEIQQHCATKRSKAQVIQCLANLMLRDVYTKKTSIAVTCQNELKFELLQRSENINFDPSLANACKAAISKFCSNLLPGNAQILDCLKANSHQVSPICFAKLRKREQIDVIDPENDYSMMSKCANPIQKYCSNQNKQNILTCLRRNINQDAMAVACRQVLFHRLMILNSDARFNKALIESCQEDIQEHCPGHIIDEPEDNESDDEDENNNDNDPAYNDIDEEIEYDETTDRDMGGRIIECLRSKYADTSITLQQSCVPELVDVIQASKLDVKLDVLLYQKCKSILASSCVSADPEDCLKVLYQNQKIDDQGCQEQIVRIIKEGQADVHVDQPLSFACQADIMKFCNDVPSGNGKQLQCLLSYKAKSLTVQCKNMLREREQLWDSVSKVDSVVDLATEIGKSPNRHIFLIIFVLFVLIVFMSGWICRPFVRRHRQKQYRP